MAQSLHRIDICHGIGDVRFGDSTKQVQTRLGYPDEIDNLGESTTLWNYRVLKFEIAFQSADWPFTSADKRVVQFLTRNPMTTLWAKPIIGAHETEVLRVFREHGYNRVTISSDIVGPFNYRTFQLHQLPIVLDFRDGVLRSVLCWDPNRASDGSLVPRPL
jgi:hypothetical protein